MTPRWICCRDRGPIRRKYTMRYTPPKDQKGRTRIEHHRLHSEGVRPGSPTPNGVSLTISSSSGETDSEQATINAGGGPFNRGFVVVCKLRRVERVGK